MKSNLLRTIALSGAIIVSPVHYKSSPNTTKYQLQELFSSENKKTVTEEIGEKKRELLIEEPEKTTVNNSLETEKPSTIDQKKSHKEKQEQKSDFISISTSDLKWSPFDPTKPMIPINATNLLWSSQHEKILNDFNKNSATHTFREILDKWIKIPLIYPSLKHIFPAHLSDLRKDPQFKTDPLSNKNQLLLIKTKNNHNALAYYQNGKLKMATYVSIGTLRHKTVTGAYEISPDQIRRRSRRYGRAPMPYALHITWGYFLHQGTSDGNPRSHGCIRVPGFYQQWLYQQVKASDKTQIIIHNPYQITQL